MYVMTVIILIMHEKGIDLFTFFFAGRGHVTDDVTRLQINKVMSN